MSWNECLKIQEGDMLVSIVIPCYRSEKTISNVVKEIEAFFDKTEKYSYEIILVNDGSPDNTFDVIRSLCAENPRITGLNLSKNWGQSSAKMAAVPYVHGDVMITMDDDGQHPVKGIVDLIAKLEEGYDLVYAYFPQKKHSWFKRLGSWFNGVCMTLLGRKEKGLHISSFAAYSAYAIKVIKQNDSPVSAMGGYVRKVSKRVTSVEIEHRERQAGKSNYSLKRMFLKWKNGVTNFSTKSLELSIRFGIFSVLASFIYAVVLFVRKLCDPSIMMGYSSIMIVILFFSGVIMLFLGILGEYIGKMFMIMIKLPNYLVRDELLNCYSGKNSEESEGKAEK